MEILFQDLRYGLRVFLKSPGFTTVAVITLALGIGANTAIFSVVNAVLLDDFGLYEPERLVLVWEDATARGGTDSSPTAPANFLDWREQSRSFEDLAAFSYFNLRVSDTDPPLAPLTYQVTTNYFEVLGAEAYLGRAFDPQRDQPEEKIVILSWRLWRGVFGGDPNIIGRDVRLSDEIYAVIGVMRPDFYSFTSIAVEPEMWIPFGLEQRRLDRTNRQVIVIGRLRESLAVEQADAEMSAVAGRVAELHPETNKGLSARVVTMKDDLTADSRPALVVLFIAVGFVLLIACANVANLLLARGATRAKEIAVRAALGASRVRIARQLLTESLMLACLSGALGMLMAVLVTPPLVSLIPPAAGVPFLSEVRPDVEAMIFALILSALTGLLFGLAPARNAGRLALVETLKEGGRADSSSGGRRMRNLLVVAEVALSLLLLAGAGVMIRSFYELQKYPTGYDLENVLTFRNSLGNRNYGDPARRAEHFPELVRRLKALPGVVSAGGVSFAPPIVSFQPVPFQISDRPVEAGREPTAVPRVILPGYFETLRIRLLQGRFLSEQDGTETPMVAVINEVLARRYFPGEDPLGKHIILSTGSRAPRQIVGIVDNVRGVGVDPAPPPAVYVPHAQQPIPIMSLVVRTEGDPLQIAQAVQRETWAMGTDMNVYAVETLDQRLAGFDWRPRFISLLLGGFAALALVLAISGIYAVMSYSVQQRTHEIGIRVALGARSSDILKMVVWQGLRLTLLGLVMGLASALVLTRLMSSLLFGVSPTDELTFMAVPVLLLGISLIACYVPARRAMRVDPMVALRHE
ncbi:MAG: ABC transporter permease [Blastocatellia bacterium]|nr:ABC transporter permease [Blastocatellia bacterium]